MHACTQDEDESQPLADIWARPRGRAEVVCELVALTAMMPFV